MVNLLALWQALRTARLRRGARGAGGGGRFIIPCQVVIACRRCPIRMLLARANQSRTVSTLAWPRTVNRMRPHRRKRALMHSPMARRLATVLAGARLIRWRQDGTSGVEWQVCGVRVNDEDGQVQEYNTNHK